MGEIGRNAGLETANGKFVNDTEKKNASNHLGEGNDNLVENKTELSLCIKSTLFTSLFLQIQYYKYSLTTEG